MRSLLSAAVVLAALITASPAAAITNGSPDANRHPNVAGLVNDTQYPDGTWIYCSGTLISPTVVLTAAHCNDDGARTRVTFDTAYVAGDKTYAGTFHSDAAYPGSTSDYHDIAVIVLDEAGPGGHQYLYDDVRMYATGTLNSINKTLLRISMNPSTGNGGTCYGDSGGPNFLGTTNTIAAITITGDAVCRSTNVDYRLDTASARAFLAQYVTLP